MLSLDQVRLLENRVEKAVAKIQDLVSENTRLRGQLSGFQSRIGELEGLVRAFKDDQGRIEEGILNALDRLSAFEDTLYTQPSVETTVPVIASKEETVQPIIEESIEITADWQQPVETAEESAVSSDGQMDIF